ncbi:RtcB family protein [Marinilabilia sp.]
MTITLKNNIGNQALIFANNPEDEALNQIKKLINSDPYKNARVRIMPDAHAGKGCTIGTTMTITDKITPNLVGVDIGCGMLTIKLADKRIDFARLDNVIRTKVPGGTKIHENIQKKFDLSGLRCKNHVDLSRASHSIGSLGGGNHFIEVSRAEASDDIYLIIHSGSRKLGSDTCSYYQKKAIGDTTETRRAKKKLIKELKKKGKEKDISTELMMLKKPEMDKDLAFLTGADFDDYLSDMAIVQRYASVNRETMAEIILNEAGLSELSRFETIHNYIDFKRMILRKGAVSAENGETLLIPINMRDGSLLCIGKGNADWNYSAPHGAGRLMSRRKAKESLDMDTFKNSMKDIYTTSVSAATLDEAPQAYKSMDEIRQAITDTVEVIDVLKPLYNFKAH